MSSESPTAQRLALAHLTVLGVAPPALFDLAARAGFDAVGLRVHPAAPRFSRAQLNLKSLRLYSRRLFKSRHDVKAPTFTALEAVSGDKLPRPVQARPKEKLECPQYDFHGQNYPPHFEGGCAF